MAAGLWGPQPENGTGQVADESEVAKCRSNSTEPAGYLTPAACQSTDRLAEDLAPDRIDKRCVKVYQKSPVNLCIRDSSSIEQQVLTSVFAL